MTDLSIADARRIALAAQGFGAGGDAARVVKRLGVVQLDSVNVVCRAHYMPPFSRIGAYDRARYDALAWGDGRRAHFEYWGHEASLLPVELQPLFRWRMQRAERGEQVWGHIARFARERRAFAARVLRELEARGPLRASEIEAGDKKEKSGRWWSRSEAKVALEWLFWAGRVTTRTRRHFERVYDLPERVLPPKVLAAPTPRIEDAHRELLRIAARALGVATEEDLRDWFRMRPADARPRIAELVEEKALAPVRVEGWAKPAYLARGAPRPRPLEDVAALLAPFDPLVWSRPRAHRLFDFHYRIEIYTPAEQREHGYYVLPFLCGERLAARVDLKADRDARTLEVRGAHAEPGPSVAERLARELAAIAAWLGLDRVRVTTRRGPLARALSSCIPRAGG